MVSLLWSLFHMLLVVNSNRYLLELFDLGVLEVPQGARVFLLNVTQTCVTDLRTHLPDVCQCCSEGLTNV